MAPVAQHDLATASLSALVVRPLSAGRIEVGGPIPSVALSLPKGTAMLHRSPRWLFASVDYGNGADAESTQRRPTPAQRRCRAAAFYNNSFFEEN